MMKNIFFISSLFLFACSGNKSIRTITNPTDTTTSTPKVTKLNPDSLKKFLSDALVTDTTEIFRDEPFCFFKSGNLLSLNEKVALFLTGSNDAKYTLELYTLKDSTFIKTSEVTGLDCLLGFFHIHFLDYNFDGQKDIYIQRVCSNGYAISRGNLITVDPSTKKMMNHPEVYNLGNMVVDKKEKTVYSVEWLGEDINGMDNIAMLTHKWVEDTLKTVSTKIERVK